MGGERRQCCGWGHGQVGPSSAKLGEDGKRRGRENEKHQEEGCNDERKEIPFAGQSRSKLHRRKKGVDCHFTQSLSES